MKIHVRSGGQGGPEVGEWERDLLVRLARENPGPHELHDDPDTADVILITDIFFDHRFWRVLANPVVLRNLDRVYLYSEKAIAYRFLPGLFTSMPRSVRDLGRFGAAMYTSHERSYENPWLEEARRTSVAPDLLFSYMGRTSHPLRRRLLKQLGAAEDAHVEDSSAYRHWDLGAPDREEFQRRYAEVLARSKFVLCPRGWAPSTIRLFETLRMGRVPVVLSDRWRRPVGPDWDSIAVFVPERELAEVPERLRALEPRSAQMGQAARSAWEEWFAPEREWATLSAALVELHGRKKLSSRWVVPLWPFMSLVVSVHYAGYRVGGFLRR